MNLSVWMVKNRNLQYLIQYGGPRVQYVWFIARSKALFIAQFTA